MFFSKLFGKKPKPTTPPVIANLPALNEWGIFFQGNGMVLYSRHAEGLPGSGNSTCMYLKSYPEVFELERKLFAEWLTTSSTGVYLQQWNDEEQAWSLIFISFTDTQLTIKQSGIKIANWQTGYEKGKPAVFIKDGSNVEVIFID